ncbi:MAG: sister chromatid cohesion protein PDS5 [Bacteroidota bacterium]
MKAINQRSISFVLLIALFLQSCGVEDKYCAVTQSGPVAAGRDVSSAASVTEVGGIQPLQVDSVVGTRSPSQAQSITASPNLSSGTTSRLDAGAEPGLKISDEDLLQYVSNSNYASTEELVTAFNTSTASSQEEYALYQWLQHYVDSWFVPSPIGQEGIEAKKYLENLEQELAQFEREEKEKSRKQQSQTVKAHRNSWLCCILPEGNNTGNSSKDADVQPKPVVKAIQTWLAGKSLEDKLRKPHLIEHYSQKDRRDGALFSKVKSEFIKQLEERINRQTSVLPRTSSIREALVKHYSEALSTLPSLLEIEEEKEISTSSVACQLWRHEEVREQSSTSTAKADNDSETGVEERDDEPIEADSQKHSVLGNLNHIGRQVTSEAPRAMTRLALAQSTSTSGLHKDEQHVAEVKGKKLIKKPIGLQDIFANTGGQTQRGSTKATQKVCIIGDAGTGKTSLTYKLAYEWAQDNWGGEFGAVYALPVRNLREDKYNISAFSKLNKQELLATAIIKECLDIEEKQHDSWREAIRQQLNEPTTLIILDGLDERAGTSKEIIQEALGGKHKLIVTSRPHAVSNDDYDVTIEHKGFSEAQKEDYVRQILSDSEASEFLSVIQNYTGISDITRIPVNLKILCYLWKEADDTASIRDLLHRGSLSELYRELTNHLWTRYQRKILRENPKPGAIEQFESRKKALSFAVDRLALHMLQDDSSSTRISKKRLEKFLKSKAEISELQALSFLQKKGDEYEFPHLTFQEHFAGKELVRKFFSTEGKSQREIAEFIRKNRYISTYTNTLIFMMGELSNRIQEHMGYESLGEELMSDLKRFCYLLNVAPQEEAGVQHLLLELHLFNEWLIITEDKYKSIGLKVLNGEEFKLGDRLKSWLRAGLCEAGSTYNPYTNDPLLPLLMKSLVKLKGISDTSAYGQVIEEVFQEAVEHYDTKRSSAALAHLPTIAKANPQLANRAYEMLEACLQLDNKETVRSSALSALSELLQVKADKAGDVFSQIQKYAKPTESIKAIQIREAAISAVVGVAKADPDLSRSVLTFLKGILPDSVVSVRTAALRAMPRLVKKEQGSDTAEVDASGLLEDILASLQSALAPNNPSAVQAAGVLALAEVGSIAPKKGERVLAFIEQASTSGHAAVRRACVEALANLDLTELTNALPIVYPLIQRACRDQDEYVKSAGIRVVPTLAGLVVDRPDLVKEAWILETLGDDAAKVRQAGIEALLELYNLTSDQKEEIFALLQTKLQDKDDNVRAIAVKKISELAAKEKDLTTKVLQHIQLLLQDKDTSVQKAARNALGSLAQEDAACMQIVKTTLEESREDPTSVSQELVADIFDSYSTDALVEACNKGIPAGFLSVLLGSRLYGTPLVFEKEKGSLILYHSSGKIEHKLQGEPGSFGCGLRDNLLWRSACNGYSEVIRDLGGNGASLEIWDNKYSMSPVHAAAYGGHLPVVTYLNEKGAQVNTASKDGWTPMHIAAENGHLPIVTYLNEQGAQMDTASKDGWTPMHIAALNGHLPVVTYLNEKGAQVDTASKDGWTPMHVATHNGHLPVVTYLNEQGAQVDTASKDGWTPMHIAAQNGHLPVVTYLNEQEAQVDTANKDGWTPILLAAQNGHLPVVTYLKEQKAQVDTANKDGWTPMHIAALIGHLPVVTYLKEHEAQVNARNKYDKTPLQLAKHNNHQAIVDFLESHGAQ